MVHSRCSSWMIFIACAFLLCCNRGVFAYTTTGTDDNTQAFSELATYIQTPLEFTAFSRATAEQNGSDTSNISSVSICPEGQYLYKCGDYRVGFNWLKSAKLPFRDNDNVIQATTKNYYVGDTTLELFEQMRNFFRKDSGTSVLCKDDSGNLMTTTEHVADRELIFNNLCHPASSVVTCAPCPNGAKVKKSVVRLDSNNLSVQGSWDVYTIADCYMEEFEDSTGSYYYEEPGGTPGQKASCYYTNTNPEALSVLNGDAIGEYVPGLNNNHTLNEAVYILTPAAMISPKLY